jgi:hypothetical protein
MEQTNKDTFEIEKKDLNESNNFFMADEDSSFANNMLEVTEPTRRLNDYDFNLLKEDAYKDVSDDLFKLEYKISKIESEIKDIDLQIQLAKDIRNFNEVEELASRKNMLIEDRDSLVAIYNDKSLSARISDKIFNFFGHDLTKSISKFKSSYNDIAESIVAKLPKRFASVLELKKSLTKLENINKSVDELISMNIPYGENIDKYDQLSKYIIKANSIQNDLSKYIR